MNYQPLPELGCRASGVRVRGGATGRFVWATCARSSCLCPLTGLLIHSSALAGCYWAHLFLLVPHGGGTWRPCAVLQQPRPRAFPRGRRARAPVSCCWATSRKAGPSVASALTAHSHVARVTQGGSLFPSASVDELTFPDLADVLNTCVCAGWFLTTMVSQQRSVLCPWC